MIVVPKLPIPYKLISMEQIGSTNEEAKRLAKLGEQKTPEGTIVWAKSQTNGRGRRGRKWVSPEGNLYLSLVLRPSEPANKAAQLGFVGAVALCGALGEVCEPGIEVYCKWPNDILVFERKVAGILLEFDYEKNSGTSFVILGLGVNLQHYPDNTEYPATSLAEEGQFILSTKLLEAFSRHFMDWTRRWVDTGFENIRVEWKRLAKGLGQDIEIKLENETLKGKFKDLDANGALLLEINGKIKPINAGSVFFC